MISPNRLDSDAVKGVDFDQFRDGGLTMDNNLKPCPLCGGEAELHDSQRNPRVPMWWVRCKLCGATSATHSTKEKAVAAWNWRTYDKS